MDRDLSSELLAVLDHSRFLSLSTQGALWQITYDDSPAAEMGAISSENLANLLTAWRGLREKWMRTAVAADAEYQRGYKAGFDRGTAEAPCPDKIAIEAISDANAALECAGIIASGSLAARIECLASERDRLLGAT